MKKDSTACYDIESKIFNSRQGTLSVTEYYGTLNGLWIELDQYQELKMCKADSIANNGLDERERIFKFLHGDDKIEKLTLKEKLVTQFEMKELGKLKYFLGIEVAYFKQGNFISQKKYVLDLLKETGKLGCKISGIPRIGCEESPSIKKSQYQRLVEKLIYLSHCRLDIAYVVSVAVERILQYLKASPRKGLLFRKEGGNLATWKSKKQNVVARSSAEAKFRVMAHDICEGLWMKIILDDLK
ncbi:putative mitochondrial protein, partial [Mucuna pruriens]